jgi:hypothetical protein
MSVALQHMGYLYLKRILYVLEHLAQRGCR